MNNFIKPTIGRVVWYKPGVGDPKSDQMQPGLICYVWSDDLVNLGVTNSNGDQVNRPEVQLFQGDPEDCPAGFCCWMPYQKQQAEKQAA